MSNNSAVITVAVELASIWELPTGVVGFLNRGVGVKDVEPELVGLFDTKNKQ